MLISLVGETGWQLSSGRLVVAIANASREIKLSGLWDTKALANHIKLERRFT